MKCEMGSIKMNQLKKNFLYNIVYQILILILPLITIPYVSRVLNADGIGIYSYTYSIISYFMLISMLGINNYGNRVIAKVRDDKEQLSQTFFSIYFIQLFMTILMIICYTLFVFLFVKEYKNIALLQSIYLFSNLFDINWFFFGIEKFKVTITRSTVLKVLSMILIFIFIKSKNDVWLYTLLLSGSTFLSQLLLFPFLKKEIKFMRITFNDVKKHIRPCLTLFIPVIAVSLYKIMDKIMLGALTNVTEVGYYEQAEKIITIPIGIVTALGTVMLPRISNLVSKGNKDSVYRYIKKSMNFMMFLSIPICFGLMAISSDFIQVFLGNNFEKSSFLICYLAITIIFISFANVIRTQYLIPMEKDRVYINSVIIGAIINLVINAILIPKYQSIGACIGTIFAELFVMLYQLIAVRKELPIIDYLKGVISFLVKSLFMFCVVLLIKRLELFLIIRVLLQITIGSLVYLLLNINYINSILDIKRFLKKYK